MLKSSDNAKILVVGLELEKKPDVSPLWDMKKISSKGRSHQS